MSEGQKVLLGSVVGFGGLALLVLFCTWFTSFAETTWSLSEMDAKGVTSGVVVGTLLILSVGFAVRARLKLKRDGIKVKWRW